jgi:hypothetical protein
LKELLRGSFGQRGEVPDANSLGPLATQLSNSSLQRECLKSPAERSSMQSAANVRFPPFVLVVASS